MSDRRGCGLLEGKVFVVAGVGEQTGPATALIGAREGAKVVLLARGKDRIARVADSIRSAGGSALPLQCDLSDSAEVRRTVETILSDYGRIDAVFYNAAFYDNRHDDLEIDEAVWNGVMNLNVKGPLSIARWSIPSMIENGGGAFVFASSGSSLLAEEARLGYGVSKSALNALTRFIASRYGRQGIRANATFPAVVAGEFAEHISALNCLGRSPRPEEIGEAVVFLCSDRASIITGEMIHLDAGMFAKAPWPSKLRSERQSSLPGEIP